MSKVLFLGILLLVGGHLVRCDEDDNEGQRNKLVDTAKVAAVAGTGAAAVTGAAAGTLGALGFTSGGIGAGTIAAAVQAKIGLVSAGSVFAGLQSLGASGALVGMMTPVGWAGAVIGGGAYYFLG